MLVEYFTITAGFRTSILFFIFIYNDLPVITLLDLLTKDIYIKDIYYNVYPFNPRLYIY